MSETPAQRRRVLIIDDHPIVRQGLAQLINQETDFEACCESEDAPSALDMAGTCKPDIAIIDISLGQSSGVRLIEDLCRRHPDIAVLALSMHDESVYAERCIRAGAKGFIMKREPPEKVLSALRKIIKGEIYLSDELSSKLLSKIMGSQHRSGAKSSPIELLSNRELEVYELIGRGLKTRDIADQLSLSIKTIETYLEHIKKKMHFRNSRDLFMHAVQWYMDPEPK